MTPSSHRSSMVVLLKKKHSLFKPMIQATVSGVPSRASSLVPPC